MRPEEAFMMVYINQLASGYDSIDIFIRQRDYVRNSITIYSGCKLNPNYFFIECIFTNLKTN